MMNQSVTIDVNNTQAEVPASPLKIWRRRLILLLVMQLLLIIGVFAYQQNSNLKIDAKPLLEIKTTDIDRLVIQDASNKVSLQKSGTEWLLPDQQLPVDKQKLEDILQKLGAIQLTWPVTTTSSSHERFEVAGTKFQRRIELFQGDAKKADIWLGTSPGFKKIHVRREGENQVYAVELTSFEFAVTGKDWLQKDLLAIKDANVIRAGDYEIQKSGDNWNFVNQDASAGKVNAAKAGELANAFNGLQIQEPVTQVPQGESIKVVAKSAAGEFEYDFITAGNNYFVKRNDRSTHFKISQNEFERIARVDKKALTASEPEANVTAPVDPVSDMTALDNVLKK
jgi:hypothetical protein